MWELLRERDRLVHHPYDDFGATVLRLLNEAADDPAVVAMKLTLYRTGESSPVVAALIRAAEAGKEVVAFVELKASYDEARNIAWVKQLERAGAQVVYGVVGLKNHAKVALVSRREDGEIRRYAHVGTGNYNAATARLYTDLGLLTADPAIGDDLGDLFNQLTGTSAAPGAALRRLLVAPEHLAARLCSRASRARPSMRAPAAAGPHPGQIERARRSGDRPRAVRGVAGRRRDRPHRARPVHAQARRPRTVRADPGARRHRPLSRARADLSLRERRGRRVLHRLGRLAIAQPAPARRSRGSGARRRLPSPARSILELELADPSAWELAADGSYRQA